MSMLDVSVVVLAFYFCLANWVFCNPLVLYGLYVLISVCMVILRMTVLYIYIY